MVDQGNKRRATTPKKVVRAQPKDRSGSGASTGRASGAPTWEATPEAKKQALILRIVAGVMWLMSIGVEVYLIFGVLAKDHGDDGFPMVTLIVALVIMGILSIVGSILWKRANHVDPASEKDKIRFFVQNQLGAVVAVVAFLPLVVLVITNDEMDKNQKAVAGGIAGVLLVIATLVGIDFNPASVERYTVETRWDQQRVIAITGEDKVYWVKTGKVFHLCPEVSPLENSTAEEIIEGTVQDAVDSGMQRLTKQVQMEINQCGLPQPDPKYLQAEPPADLSDVLTGGSGDRDTTDSPDTTEKSDAGEPVTTGD